MKQYKYLKCRFCADKMKCVIDTYGNGVHGGKCRYGTLLSCYRWFIRSILITAALIVQGLIVYGVSRITHLTEGYGNISMFVMGAAFLLIEIAVFCISMHECLREKHGTIWGKE